jgi:ethanolamine ammonia-lyase small subunit
MAKNTPVTIDPWDGLRRATPARIALGRAGGSLPTREWLDFKSAHAAARDAVHYPFDAGKLAENLSGLGIEVVVVESRAGDRLTFLQRPDLGRQLSERYRYVLQERSATGADLDLAIIVSDGLSALAIERHARPLLAVLMPKLADDAWVVAPVVVARFGRVALQDEIGYALKAQIALTLIGERPGLGSADSLGAYLVYAPRPGNTDANRNCVSNIRSEGLPYDVAAETIRYLLTEARSRRLSGVGIKDQRSLATVERPGSRGDPAIGQENK